MLISLEALGWFVVFGGKQYSFEPEPTDREMWVFHFGSLISPNVKVVFKENRRMFYAVQIPEIFIMISRYFSSLKSFSHATSTSLLSVPLHRYIVKYLPSLISTPHKPHFFNSSPSVLYSTLCRFKTYQSWKNNPIVCSTMPINNKLKENNAIFL